MLNSLRQRLADPDIDRQLQTLAAGAPASAPLIRSSRRMRP